MVYFEEQAVIYYLVTLFTLLGCTKAKYLQQMSVCFAL